LTKFESKSLICKDAYNARLVLVREALLQFLQDQWLRTRIFLSYLLKISWQLSDYSFLVDITCLFVDLLFELFNESCNTLLDLNLALVFICFSFEFDYEVALAPAISVRVEYLHSFLIFHDLLAIQDTVEAESSESEQEYFIHLISDFDKLLVRFLRGAEVEDGALRMFGASIAHVRRIKGTRPPQSFVHNLALAFIHNLFCSFVDII